MLCILVNFTFLRRTSSGSMQIRFYKLSWEDEGHEKGERVTLFDKMLLFANKHLQLKLEC